MSYTLVQCACTSIVNACSKYERTCLISRTPCPSVNKEGCMSHGPADTDHPSLCMRTCADASCAMQNSTIIVKTHNHDNYVLTI